MKSRPTATPPSHEIFETFEFVLVVCRFTPSFEAGDGWLLSAGFCLPAFVCRLLSAGFCLPAFVCRLLSRDFCLLASQSRN
jgi:hypothetical protein